MRKYIKFVTSYLESHEANECVRFIDSLCNALFIEHSIVVGRSHFGKPMTVVVNETYSPNFNLYEENAEQRRETLESAINFIMGNIPIWLYRNDHIQIIRDTISELSMRNLTVDQAATRLNGIFPRSVKEQMKTIRLIHGQIDLLYRSLDAALIKYTCKQVDGFSNYSDIDFAIHQAHSIPHDKRDMVMMLYSTSQDTNMMNVSLDANGNFIPFSSRFKDPSARLMIVPKTVSSGKYDLTKHVLKRIVDGCNQALQLELEYEYDTIQAAKGTFMLVYKLTKAIDDETIIEFADMISNCVKDGVEQ